MSEQKDPKIDGLTKELLMKCEVTGLSEFYQKWLQENDHIVPIKKICSFHKNFNEEKIIEDISGMDDFIVISLYEYFRNKEGDKDIAREKYLTDYFGLIKLIRSLKKRHFFKKQTPIKEIIDKLGLTDTLEAQKKKLVFLLQNAASDKQIHAKLVSRKPPKGSKSEGLAEEGSLEWLDLVLFSKLSLPQHKKNFLYLIITLSIIILSITVFLPLLFFINQ